MVSINENENKMRLDSWPLVQLGFILCTAVGAVEKHQYELIVDRVFLRFLLRLPHCRKSCTIMRSPGSHPVGWNKMNSREKQSLERSEKLKDRHKFKTKTAFKSTRLTNELSEELHSLLGRTEIIRNRQPERLFLSQNWVVGHDARFQHNKCSHDEQTCASAAWYS